MRYLFFSLLIFVASILGVAGLRGSKSTRSPIEIFNDMDNQAKKKGQAESDFFADGRNARPPIPGVLPIGHQLPEKPFHAGGGDFLSGYGIGEDYLNTGKMGEFYGHGMPAEVKVDEAFLRRGQDRFGIYCAICHGPAGDGTGVVSKYGVPAANLLVFDPAQKPDGSIFDVITNGRGNMGRYGAQLTVGDRWAVVAYVRVLQQRNKMPAADAKALYDEWEKTQAPAQPNKKS